MKYRRWKKRKSSTTVKVDGAARSHDEVELPLQEPRGSTLLALKKKNKEFHSQARIDKVLCHVLDKQESNTGALATYAQWLSPSAINEYLMNESAASRNCEARYRHYLHTIVAIGRAKVDLVHSVEIERARCLLDSQSCADSGALVIGEELADAVPLLLPYPSSSAITLQKDIRRLVIRLCYNFACAFSAELKNGDYVSAYNSTRWLARPAVEEALKIENSDFRSLLDTCLPSWRMWAAWEPNKVRMQTWSLYSKHAPSTIKDLLKLEGPDISGENDSEQKTFREGLVFRDSESPRDDLTIASVAITARNDLLDGDGSLFHILDELTKLIDHATTADPIFTDLLDHFCRSQKINWQALKLVDCVRIINDTKFTRIIKQDFERTRWRFLYGLDLDEVLYIIPFLGDARIQPLKDRIIPDVIEQVSDHLIDLRTTVLDSIHLNRVCEVSTIEIVELSQRLQGSTWFLKELSPSVRRLVCNPPDISKLRRLAAIRKLDQLDSQLPSNNLEQQIDQYVHVCLAVAPEQSESDRVLIDTLIDVYGNDTNTRHQELAVFVAESKLGGSDFKSCCIRDIANLSHLYIDHICDALFLTGTARHPATRAALRILARKVSDVARLRLRTILRAAIFEDTKLIFEHFKQDLNFTAYSELLYDIRTVFPGMEGKELFGSSFSLNQEVHAWFEKIDLHPASRRHLEDVLGEQPTLGLLLRSFPSHASDILALLETMDQLKSRAIRERQELTSLILSKMSNPQLILRVQATLLTLLDVGVETLEKSISLIRAQRQESTGFANLFWTQLMRSELQEEDRLALHEVGKLFAVNTNPSTGSVKNVIENTAEDLQRRYARLIDEARRLENLRLSTQTIKPEAMWDLLEELDIRRPPVLIDILARVPESLQSVIEAVSEHDVEMHFPVSLLTRMQRVAIGVNDDDNFVVRLSIGGDGRLRDFVYTCQAAKHRSLPRDITCPLCCLIETGGP